MTHESQYIPGSTIGKHLRHSLDHYRLLIDAASSSKTKNTPLDLNYDIRVRLLDMETDPQAALDVFRSMDQQLDRIVSRTSLNKQIRLTALTPHHQEFDTSFGREVSRIFSVCLGTTLIWYCSYGSLLYMLSITSVSSKS
jgi:hypothetical protein